MNFEAASREATAVFNVRSEAEPGEVMDVAFEWIGDSVVGVTVGENVFRIEIIYADAHAHGPFGPSRLYCTIDGVPREFTVSRTPTGQTCVLADGHTRNFEIRRGRGQRSTTPRSGGSGERLPLVICPMPATVVEVLVDAGSTVSAGDAVVRVEAMKMITVLTAPVAGEVQEISALQGHTVRPRQVLARIREQQGSATSIGRHL
ncbi:acetyl-CoA carboxylase biotin carboxyl carrier protein subunit [Amycolatopsis sp. NPDC059090]|uniref:acetyl-CoA carboxylase biotin carboxyl carrier protein subunit n=1 Tax=Amycolatopsis sp. NPDC059090 TaxID=3346723 RepID=UPI00367165D9